MHTEISDKLGEYLKDKEPDDEGTKGELYELSHKKFWIYPNSKCVFSATDDGWECVDTGRRIMEKKGTPIMKTGPLGFKTGEVRRRKIPFCEFHK